MLQDDAESFVSVQNAIRGDLSTTKRKAEMETSLENMKHMPSPGIQPIKQMEL